jgi:hypothetical protein
MRAPRGQGYPGRRAVEGRCYTGRYDGPMTAVRDGNCDDGYAQSRQKRQYNSAIGQSQILVLRVVTSCAFWPAVGLAGVEYLRCTPERPRDQN